MEALQQCLCKNDKRERWGKKHLAEADTNPNQIQLIGSIKMIKIWMINPVVVWESEGYNEIFRKDF